MLLAVLAVAACAKEEAPAVDSAAPAVAPPVAAALTPADLAGTWTGTIKQEGTDSVTNFTVVRTSDSTGKFIEAGSKDSVAYTMRYDADSVITTSASYTDPTLPKGTGPVMFRSIGRLKDGKLVGTAALMLASKPDSVLSRSTWEATKTP
jgi:hypothetical protein